MHLSLRVVQAKFATFAMDEVISATVARSILGKLDPDSIAVDVPVALTTLRALRLPQILRRLHPQRLPGTTLDTFNSRETPTLVSHRSLFGAAIHAFLGNHHMSDNCTLCLLRSNPISTLWLATFPQQGFHLLVVFQLTLYLMAKLHCHRVDFSA